MKKIFYFIILLFLLLTTGCATKLQTDNYKRISGIVHACKSSPQNRKIYLKQKVESKQISQKVAYVIQECLK